MVPTRLGHSSWLRTPRLPVTHAGVETDRDTRRGLFLDHSPGATSCRTPVFTRMSAEPHLRVGESVATCRFSFAGQVILYFDFTRFLSTQRYHFHFLQTLRVHDHVNPLNFPIFNREQESHPGFSAA